MMEVKQEKELRTLNMDEMVATDGGFIPVAIAAAIAVPVVSAIVNNWDEFTAGYKSVAS